MISLTISIFLVDDKLQSSSLTTLFLLLASLPVFFFLFNPILRWLIQHHLLKFSSSSSSHYGPPTYPLIGCLISFYKNRYRLLDWYTGLLSESPTHTIIVHRFGAPRNIITANPKNVEYILKTNFNNFPKGKPFREILGDFLGCGIFNVDGDLWCTQRKLASHEFTNKCLKNYISNTLEKEVKKRLLPILELSSNYKVLDLQDLLRRFAFDTICKFSIGLDPGCLDPSLPISPLEKSFDLASEISAKRATAPLFVIWKIKRALRVGSEKQLSEAIKHVHESVSNIIRSKRLMKKQLNNNEGEVDNEMRDLDLLTRLILDGHDEKMILDMVISFMMAGRDSTSAAMTWLFWLLSKHPNVERELMKEVNKFDEKLLDYEVLKEMIFLKACILESMRLYPPVAWDSKHAVNHDVLPDGTTIRKGDRVTYFPYGMGRMEKLWGKNRFEFRPDRWLLVNEMPDSNPNPNPNPNKEFVNHEEEYLKNVCPYKYPVFQAGPRMCLGKEMAFIQMKYVVASVLRRFKVKPVSLEEPVFVPFLTAQMAGGFRVRVQPRERKWN
ncbi:Cytochrome P450 [Macleaya cordata]|uniref:Cytochrome P450 n=1 Tax=Macleaya cordata TaxID=56857 RepID=A0A200QGK1_MACCD|nr:Cytochrome P450 [Macleaya cordata]